MAESRIEVQTPIYFKNQIK